jgi:hypothetical protein
MVSFLPSMFATMGALILQMGDNKIVLSFGEGIELQIDTPDLETVALQAFHQVTTDETARTEYQSRFSGHLELPAVGKLNFHCVRRRTM